MSRPRRTILLVEDETSITEPLAEALRSASASGSVIEVSSSTRRIVRLGLLILEFFPLPATR